MDKKTFLFAILLLCALAMADPIVDTPAFNNAPVNPMDAIFSQTNIITEITILLMMAMVVLAASAYVIGQFFGAETRAKATVWAQGMLIAVGISLAVLVVLNFLMPNSIAGEGPLVSVTEMIGQLAILAQMALFLMVALCLVIGGAVYAIGQMYGAETRAKATVWSTTLVAAAIFSAVLYVVIYDLLLPLGSTFFAGTLLGLYGGAIVTVTFLVTMFILITFILSKFFKVPEWEAYLNVEMSNLMTSFLIVLFVLGLFVTSSAISLSMSGGTYSSPPQAAIVYMQGTVADSALKAAMDVYKINACTSMLSTFSRRIGEFVLTQTYKVFPGLDTFVSITNVLGFTLLSLYNTTAVQIGLLYFIDATMVPFFMPAGLVLRFFPPTRDAGAFLISLAFGLQIVFPTTYLINKQVFIDVNSDNPIMATKPYQSPTILIQSLCGPFKYGVWGYLLNPSASPITQLIPGSSTVISFLSKLVSESLLNAVSMAEFIPIMKHIAALSLVTLFMPALAMMVTIAFINAMTKFIVAKV
jgi:hypothetical protein